MHKVRPGWKLIAVTYWYHREGVLGGNFAPEFRTKVKSLLGEISPRAERVTTYKSFLRSNVFLGKDLTCKGPLFYYVSQEIWLCSSRKLLCIDQSRFYIFSHPREFNFSFFNNKRTAGWVAHIARVFLTFYSCWYYSSMVFVYK